MSRLLLPRHPVALTALLAALSMGLASLSPVFSGVDSSNISVWLPVGLIYAAALSLGWAAVPGLALGQFLHALLVWGHGPLAACLPAAGNAACAAVLVAWAQRHRPEPGEDAPLGPGFAALDPLTRPGLFALSLGALAVGSGLNAVAGALAFKPAEQPLPDFMALFMLGDLAGALLVGPLLMHLMRWQLRDWQERSLEWAVTVGAGLLVLYAVLTRPEPIPVGYLAGLMLPLLLWSALRYSVAQTCLALSIVSLAVLMHAAERPGNVLAASGVDAMLAAQTLVTVLAASALMVSANRRHLAAASVATERLNQTLIRAESLARIGSWRQELVSGQLYWSPQVYDLFGLSPDTHVPDYAHFLRLVHPEDRAKLDAAWKAALGGAASPFEYRIILGSGVRWLRALAEFEFDATGKPVMAWGTVQDISDERALLEAHEARARAEAANQAKTSFLATLSHEIRTPLNGVIGLAELAREADLSEATRRDYLNQLGESARLLNDIISDVLDISKIEAGRVEIEAVEFPLRELLASLHTTYRTLGEDKGLSMTLDLAPELPSHVRGDPTRLRQVLNNYLSNALKFTAQGGLTLRARRDGDDTLFEVRDTGMGLGAEAAEKLFQPFTQGDASDTRRFGGTGLGLAICRELATLMGGTVGVRSQPGQGSTFWLRLALPAVAAPPLAPGARLTEAAKQTPPLAGLRLLMAEDNKTNALVATRMLERAGATVTWVEDGAAAVAAMTQVERSTGATHARWPFDLVLMDVHMPVLDGLSATRQLRAWEATKSEAASDPRLPILAMTAGVLPEQQQAALDAGMDGFIAKPLSKDALLAAVQRLARPPGA